MDEEQKEFAEALLQSIKQMKAGEWARKTVFKVDGDEVRRVSQELPSQDGITPSNDGLAFDQAET